MELNDQGEWVRIDEAPASSSSRAGSKNQMTTTTTTTIARVGSASDGYLEVVEHRLGEIEAKALDYEKLLHDHQQLLEENKRIREDLDLQRFRNEVLIKMVTIAEGNFDLYPI